MGLNSQHSPRVSILLPTHNRADVLPFAIRSVLAQTVQDFELLIAGDGCTDNTADIVQSFNDPRVHWFDLPKGPAFGYANRNTVLRKARGEIVAYMQHDDLWLCDHLEQLLPFFDDENIDIAFSRPLWVIPSGMIVPGLYNLNHAQILNIFLNIRNEIPSVCAVHRRDCFSRYGYWDDKLTLAADWDLWKRIIKGGGERNFSYLSDGTCLHFKANWQDESYDRAFGFRFWRRLFASDQMPTSLKMDVRSDVTEQEAVWEVISPEPQLWSCKIRTAIMQVLDVCALQRNLLAEALLEFNEEFMNEPLSLNASFGYEFSPLIATLRQIQANRKILDDTQAALAVAQKELMDTRKVLDDAQAAFADAQKDLMDTRKILEDTRAAFADTQKDLMEIKKTLTWRLRVYLINIYFVRKLYLMIVMAVRRWRSTFR
jgi:glycosyltransferase involved in cell wall biosynthesis